MNHDSAGADPRPTTLVVLLHAYTHHGSNLESVEAVVRQVWPNADVHRPDLPASVFSMANPNEIVVGLLAAIDKKYGEALERNIPCEEIVLVGHSLGALLARKLYVVACGEVERAPLEDEFR